MSIFPGLLMAAAAYAGPGQFTHQGRILDADGSGVEGEVEITFRLMDEAADGDTLWEETFDLSVTSGFYSVVLGADKDTNPLDLEILDQAPLWLEVQITDAAPMVPRQSVDSVPYATLAQAAEEVLGGPVDASSVSVGGTEVIDEDGTWTGATPAVSWSDLSDVPEGLADGSDADTDSLAELGVSCIEGDVPRWDSLSGAWFCDLDAVLSEADVLSYVEGADLALGAGTTLGGLTPRFTDTSITWDELTGVPAGFVDGIDDDSDTLSDISCSSEGVLVYTPGSGWDCGTDTDTTLSAEEVQELVESLIGLDLDEATTIGGRSVRFSDESILVSDIAADLDGVVYGDGDGLGTVDCAEGEILMRQADGWACSALASAFDGDGDGSLSWADCDDSDPTRFVGATEVWYDGIDTDCSGGSDYDADGDGYAHEDYDGVDCDDANPSISISGDSSSCPALSCADIKNAGHHTDNGYYWVSPGGSAFQVYCDLSTADGGWTLAVVISGENAAHYNRNAVGSFGYPDDLSTAKLSDIQINQLSGWDGDSSDSVYMFTCNGETDYLLYQLGWNSTANNDDADFTHENSCDDYACVVSGEYWTYYTGGTSSSDHGGGSYPHHDAMQYRADFQNGCYNEGYGRSGLLWVR